MSRGPEQILLLRRHTNGQRYKDSAEVTPASVVGRVIIYSFNLNNSPNISYGGLEYDIVILQNHMLMVL